MKPFAVLTSLLFVLLVAGCSRDPDTLVRDGYDEDEMEAAIARAHAELDEFLADFRTGQSENYAVKVPISDGENVEHFWLSDIEYANGQFRGTINNDPGLVSNVTLGQEWTVAKDEISDWMYMRGGKMYGNYTMRPLLASMPEDQAERFKAMFAKP